MIIDPRARPAHARMDDFNEQYEAARESRRAARLKARERREEHRRVAKYEPVDQDKWQTLAWRVIKDGDLLSRDERAYYLRGRREQRYRDGILAYQDFKRVEDLAGVEVREGARGAFKVYPLADKLSEADQQTLRDGRSREAGQQYVEETKKTVRSRLKDGYHWAAGVERGLRSNRSRVLQRFVQCTHKAVKRKPRIAKYQYWARPGTEFRSTEKDVQSARITSLCGKYEWPRKHFTFEPAYEDRPARVKIESVPDGFRAGEDILVHLVVPPFVFRSGDEKDMLVPAPRGSKLLGLDRSYIETNRVMAAVMRVDLDCVFANWAVLRAVLEYHLPFLPQIIVGEELPDGRIKRPHLWFLLPSGSEVWWAPGDPRCRRHPMLMFSAVHAAIVSALAPIGADIGCLANPWHGKNPISPQWTAMVIDRDWPTLSEMMAGLRKYRAEGRIQFETSAEATLRRGVAEDLELTEFGAGSNIMFTAAWVWSFELLRKAAIEGDAAYLAAAWNSAAIEDWLLPRLAAQVYGQYGQTPAAKKIVARCARERARLWDPARSRAECRRGAAADRVAGTTDMRKRMQIGGQFARQLVKKTSVEAIADAMLAMRDEGLRLTELAIVERCGRSIRTVQRRWSEAEHLLLSGYTSQAVDREQSPLSLNDNQVQSESYSDRPARASNVLFRLDDGRLVVRTWQRMPVPNTDRPGWTTAMVPVIAAVESFHEAGHTNESSTIQPTGWMRPVNNIESYTSTSTSTTIQPSPTEGWMWPEDPINLTFSHIDITSALAENKQDFDPSVTIIRPGMRVSDFDEAGNDFETWTDSRSGAGAWPRGVRVKQRSVSVASANDAASDFVDEIGRLRRDMHYASLVYESGRPDGLPVGNARPTSDLLHIVDYDALADTGDWGEAEDSLESLGISVL